MKKIRPKSLRFNTPVKTCLEEALKEELNEHLGFGHYERSSGQSKPPEAQRSRYFRRRVNTDHGTIPDLRVPKLRRLTANGSGKF